VHDAASARQLMMAQPSAIKRPVVEWGTDITVGFDAAAWAGRIWEFEDMGLRECKDGNPRAFQAIFRMQPALQSIYRTLRRQTTLNN